MKLETRKQMNRQQPQGKEEVSASSKIVEAGNKIKEDIDKLTTTLMKCWKRMRKNSSEAMFKEVENDSVRTNLRAASEEVTS